MCGRYTLTTSHGDELTDRFAGDRPPPPETLERWNVAPTEAVAIVLPPRPEANVRRLRAGRWGLLPPGATDLKARPQPINARRESVASNRLFARLLEQPDGRCLVLADGYYEWLRPEDKRIKPTPFRYTVDDGTPFAFAGLVNHRKIEGELVRSVAILTCPANALAARVHDRMPVILSGPDAERAWLEGDLDQEALLALCTPLDADRMAAAPVSTRVNKAGTGDEGPWLLEPDEPATLF